MSSVAQQIKIVVNGGTVHLHGGEQFAGMDSAASVYLPDEDDDVQFGEIVMQKPEITYNTTRITKARRKAPDGIEIRFGDARPTEPVRQQLRDAGYQFSEKQTMWYAIDNEKSRTLAEQWMEQEIEMDNTHYIKHAFWARVKHFGEYQKLRNRTEFFVKMEPPQNFYTKSFLEKAHNVNSLIQKGVLMFKKFYNKVAEEEEPSGDPQEPGIDPGSNNEPDPNWLAEKLQALADGMKEQIASKMNSATSRQRPTAKRLRVAAGMREDGMRLLRIQEILYALAEAYRSGEIEEFNRLKHVRNKSDVAILTTYDVVLKNKWSQENIQGYFEQNVLHFQKLGINSVFEWSLASVHKNELLLKHNQSAYFQSIWERDKKLKELEMKAWEAKIPGFFPTPPDLIARMLELADLEYTHRILEPSAGKGDILDAIRVFFSGMLPKLFAVERNYILREILEHKEYSLWEGTDFLELRNETFDRILMNPPFENGQDIDHVTHALTLLGTGGRIVAIMGEGFMFRSFKKDMAFRELLKHKNAFISESIEGAFKNGFNTTGIRVRIVAINEDGSPVVPGAGSHINDDPIPTPFMTTNDDEEAEELEMLELEAQAELELLQLKLEIERKRRNGVTDRLSGTDSAKLQYLRRRAWALQQDPTIFDFK